MQRNLFWSSSYFIYIIFVFICRKSVKKEYSSLLHPRHSLYLKAEQKRKSGAAELVYIRDATTVSVCVTETEYSTSAHSLYLGFFHGHRDPQSYPLSLHLSPPQPKPQQQHIPHFPLPSNLTLFSPLQIPIRLFLLPIGASSSFSFCFSSTASSVHPEPHSWPFLCPHFRHHSPRRRAVPGRLHDLQGEAGCGAAACQARRRHHRGRLPCRLQGWLRGRQNDRPRGRQRRWRRRIRPRHLWPLPLQREGHSNSLGGRQVRQEAQDSHLHRHQRHSHGVQVENVQRQGRRHCPQYGQVRS